MFKWLKFVLTDESNQWDLGILIWFTGCVQFLATSVKAYIIGTQAWDPQSFGTGLLGVLGAGAALQWIRQKGNEKVVVTQTETPPVTTTLVEKTTNAVKEEVK